MDNRREFTRIVRPLEVDIVSGNRIAGTTRDLSMNGAFVVSETTLPAGTHVGCTLFLDGRTESPRIKATGQVVRSNAEGMAIEFSALEGLESFEHLQRLLLLNAGNQVEQVEREFAAHIGLKPR